MTLQSQNSFPCLGADFVIAVNERPKKKRLSPLSVRLSSEQRAQLEKDAVGMSLNAYVLSKLFDAPKRKRQPTKRDKAIASALRRMAHSGIAAYLASQIVAQDEGRLGLSSNEAAELREAYEECYLIRCDLIEALGLQAEYDTRYPQIIIGKPK